ncbi:MAG: CARDB domain-containing protein [Victivallaceae bacterium]
MIKKMFCGFVALIAVITVSAMPSYDDVLVVVNDKSAQSLEIGDYFKKARKIPDINICHISVKDLQAQGFNEYGNMPLVDRNSAVAAIKKYLSDNSLTDKINYIVLTRGIPYFSWNDPAGSSNYQLFDLYLLFQLSESAVTSSIPDVFTYNKYFYYIESNYDNQIDYKFTQKKYGYYIISRLDGPGTVNIKKMIDSTGYPAYQSYKKPIKFLTMTPLFPYYPSVAAEFKKRGNINIVAPDLKNGQVVADIGQDIMFGYWNRVDFSYPGSVLTGIELFGPYYGTCFYGDSDVEYYYPNIYYDLTFMPGSMIMCFRSWPARGNHRMYGGMFKFAPAAASKLTDYKKSDGSDMKFRHMSCVEYDPVNNWVWCGTGDNPLLVDKSYSYSDLSDQTAHKYESGRGGGIAIFDQAGNIQNHLNKGNSPLVNNRVTKIAYDKYANRMWVAHYGGIQYYDLAKKTWSEIPALKNDFAAACGIYVDSYDTDKVYFSFYYSGSSLKNRNCSLLANADTNIFEYSKSAGTIKSYLLESSVLGIFPLIAKTSADTLWVTKNIGYLYKYDLKTGKVLEKINIKDQITEIAALAAGDTYALRPPSAIGTIPVTKTVLVATACYYTYKTPPANGANVVKNYVLRITDNGAGASTVELINCDLMNHWVAGSRNTIWSLITDPTNLNTVYMSLADRVAYASGYPQVILKSADQGRTWTNLTPTDADRLPLKNLTELAIDPNGIIYGVRGYDTKDQTNFSDFIAFGVSAFGGGLSHDNFTYNTSPAPAPSGGTVATGIYNSTTDAENEAYSMMFMLLDGYYYGEARFGIFKQYPAIGGGGYVAHMLVFEPKCAPFAPRVDEENMKSQVINKTTIEIPLFSPGLPPDLDGFIPETINANTVKITDETGKPVTLSKMEYNAVGRKIVLTGDLSGMVYQVTLKCGIDGIKNIKGASLTNTRADECKDEITYAFGDGILVNPEIYTPTSTVGPVQMPQSNSKCDLSVDKVWWDKPPVAGQPLTVKYQICNVGTVKTNAAAGDLVAKVYLNNIKMDMVTFGNLAPKASVTLSSTINGGFITAGKQTTIMVWADAKSKLLETREGNNINSATFFLDNRPDLKVTAITLSSTKAGKVTVNFAIANAGVGPTAAGAGAQTAAIYVNGSPAGTVNYDDLAKGATVALKLNNVTTTAGTCKVRVVADSTGKVTEANENNNILEKVFVIAK